MLQRLLVVIFQPFKTVAQYKNPVNGNNWYMPGVGDWDLALQYFGVANATSGYSRSNAASHSWGGKFRLSVGRKFCFIR